MSLLDEQLVEEWLNRNRFFTIRGLKTGLDEIDLLAIKQDNKNFECLHVEVQISFRPIGYVGGNTSARRRSEDELREGVTQWVDKKFTNARKIKKRNAILKDAKWKFVFVHGVLRDEMELSYMRQFGVQVIPYRQILIELRDGEISKSSSDASGIIEILRFMR